MKFILKAYTIMEVGQRKDADGNPHQEDSIFPADPGEDDRLFILCDGMGGHDSGEVASATVCGAMSRYILTKCPAPEGNFAKEDVVDAVNAAFDALDEVDTPPSPVRKKMGTTMTMLKFFDGGAYVAHMGDSRVYQLRPGQTQQQTRVIFQTEDHSLVNDLVRIGELTPEEARNSRQRNVITRAMQPHQERRSRAEIHLLTDIQPGDYFYLCSDGMLENMDNDNLCYYFSKEGGDDPNKVAGLINATKYNRDNHSAFLIHVVDVIGAPTDRKEPGVALENIKRNSEENSRVDYNVKASPATNLKPRSNKSINLGAIAGIVLLLGFGSWALFRPAGPNLPGTEDAVFNDVVPNTTVPAATEQDLPISSPEGSNEAEKVKEQIDNRGKGTKNDNNPAATKENLEELIQSQTAGSGSATPADSIKTITKTTPASTPGPMKPRSAPSTGSIM